jgi:hypothetical protein
MHGAHEYAIGEDDSVGEFEGREESGVGPHIAIIVFSQSGSAEIPSGWGGSSRSSKEGLKQGAAAGEHHFGFVMSYDTNEYGGVVEVCVKSRRMEVAIVIYDI